MYLILTEKLNLFCNEDVSVSWIEAKSKTNALLIIALFCVFFLKVCLKRNHNFIVIILAGNGNTSVHMYQQPIHGNL